VTASLVTIQGSGSSSKAKVTTAGRLQVDTGGVGTQTFNCGPQNQKCTALDIAPLGSVNVDGSGNATVIASGTASVSKNGCGGVIQAVTVDNASGTTATLSITAQSQGGPGGSVPIDVWQGTVPAGGHMNDAFGTGGIGYNAPVSVTEAGGAAKWYVYGDSFCPGSRSARSRRHN
jgi:hypothetical protein